MSTPTTDTTTPTITFHPEPLAKLRARFPDALERVWTAREILAGGDRPGRNPRYIFDHADGLRLIVSVDDPPMLTGRSLHVSVSAEQDSDAALELQHVAEGDALTASERMAHWTRDRVQSLAGFEIGEPLLCMCRNSYVFHVLFPPPPEIVLVHPEAEA